MIKNIAASLFIIGYSNLLFAQEKDSTFYDEEKTLIKEIFLKKNNLPEGAYQRFNVQGDLVESGVFSAGKREGLFVSLFPDSRDTLRKVYYSGGLKTGPAVTWHQNGAVFQE